MGTDIKIEAPMEILIVMTVAVANLVVADQAAANPLKGLVVVDPLNQANQTVLNPLVPLDQQELVQLILMTLKMEATRNLATTNITTVDTSEDGIGTVTKMVILTLILTLVLVNPDQQAPVDLQRADLQGADLQRADLQGADLQRADLQRVDLQNLVLPNQVNLALLNLQELVQPILMILKMEATRN